MQSLLLGAGALSLLIAGALFVTLTWGSLSIGIRTLLLAGMTGAMFALVTVAAKRSLRGSAEALSVVAFGFLVADLGGAYAADLFGLESVKLSDWFAVSALVVAVSALATSAAWRRTRLRVPGVVPQLTIAGAVPVFWWSATERLLNDHLATLSLIGVAFFALVAVGLFAAQVPLAAHLTLGSAALSYLVASAAVIDDLNNFAGQDTQLWWSSTGVHLLTLAGLAVLAAWSPWPATPKQLAQVRVAVGVLAAGLSLATFAAWPIVDLGVRWSPLLSLLVLVGVCLLVVIRGKARAVIAVMTAIWAFLGLSNLLFAITGTLEVLPRAVAVGIGYPFITPEDLPTRQGAAIRSLALVDLSIRPAWVLLLGLGCAVSLLVVSRIVLLPVGWRNAATLTSPVVMAASAVSALLSSRLTVPVATAMLTGFAVLVVATSALAMRARVPDAGPAGGPVGPGGPGGPVADPLAEPVGDSVAAANANVIAVDQGKPDVGLEQRYRAVGIALGTAWLLIAAAALSLNAAGTAIAMSAVVAVGAAIAAALLFSTRRTEGREYRLLSGCVAAAVAAVAVLIDSALGQSGVIEAVAATNLPMVNVLALTGLTALAGVSAQLGFARRVPSLRLGLEVGALAGGIAVLAVAASAWTLTDEFTLSWLALTVCLVGVIQAVISLLSPDRIELRYSATLFLLVASWLRLYDTSIDAVEAYTLPAALLLLVLGIRRMRSDKDVSSWLMLAPGLLLAFLPTLVVAWAGDEPLRTALLALGAVVALAIGFKMRWSAPLVVGSLVAVGIAVRMLGPVLEDFPRWIIPASLGAALVWAGVTWESRRANLRTAVSFVSSMR